MVAGHKFATFFFFPRLRSCVCVGGGLKQGATLQSRWSSFWGFLRIIFGACDPGFYLLARLKLELQTQLILHVPFIFWVWLQCLIWFVIWGIFEDALFWFWSASRSSPRVIISNFTKLVSSFRFGWNSISRGYNLRNFLLLFLRKCLSLVWL